MREMGAHHLAALSTKTQVRSWYGTKSLDLRRQEIVLCSLMPCCCCCSFSPTSLISDYGGGGVVVMPTGITSSHTPAVKWIHGTVSSSYPHDVIFEGSLFIIIIPFDDFIHSAFLSSPTPPPPPPRQSLLYRLFYNSEQSVNHSLCVPDEFRGAETEIYETPTTSTMFCKHYPIYTNIHTHTPDIDYLMSGVCLILCNDTFILPEYLWIQFDLFRRLSPHAPPRSPPLSLSLSPQSIGLNSFDKGKAVHLDTEDNS